MLIFPSLKNRSKIYSVIAPSYVTEEVIILVNRKVMLLINLVVTVQHVCVGQAYRRTYGLRYN